MAYLEKKLHYINPKTISPDPNNPRGETEKQIISDDNFKRLVASIKEYGVLEPLIVRKDGNRTNHRILVDGERRLRASLEAKLKEVPVLVAKDEINGRILAYQVHKLRKDWSKKTETKSIKIIIEEIQEKHPKISERELRKKIREITNSAPSDIRDILDMIKYDDDIIEQVVEGKNKNLQMSHLVQIEQSFVNKITKKFPEILEKHCEHEIRHILAKKAAKGFLGNTRYLVATFNEVFKEKHHHEEIRDLLLGFLRRKSEKIEKAYSAFKEVISPSPTVKRKAKKKTKNKKKKKAIKSTPVPVEIDHKAKLRVAEVEIIKNHVFDLMFNNLKDAVLEFERRTKTKFNNEPELQNFIYSMLRTLFESTEFEDPTEKRCGTSNRLDFVLKDHKIIIEVKYVRDKTHAKKITKELSEDYPR